MKAITTKTFDEIINSEGLTVVDFSATWCMPCRMLKPIIEKVESKLEEFKFFNLDVDNEEEIAKRYRIFSVPTIVCFKNGKKIDSLVGLNSYDDIIEFVLRCDKTKLED